MIDRQQLLADLQKLLVRLEADLLERSESAEVPQVGETLRADYEQAKAAARTAQNYEDWRSDAITQAAAAWVLSCVFVRFLEDNRLIEPPKIAGPGERLRQARDEWELYLAKNSAPNERDYLLSVFDALAALPGTKDVFGAHNPIRELPNWLSGDAARDLLNFFQKINAETGLLIHDFTDPDWDTRFLGDLYQDLSEAARKKYALLQTPEFVEEFILDRTLDPALDEFGLDAPPVKDFTGTEISDPGFRMIDPACGSGHFLLGSFRRILDRWQRRELAAKPRDLVQRTLDSIYGVDVNPYAVAIARFRLLLVAMRACGITRLADAPAFHLNLACGDSLLHGPGSAVQGTLGDIAEIHHAYQPEDLKLLRKYLTTGTYHAVVANPPYIVPRDRALGEAYRRRYRSCHRQYSLAAPFMERIYQLAILGSSNAGVGAAGFTGQITANSFMKREFGKKLIEWFLPQIDLTHVLDTSGAYIPGHGTPTVILFGRNRQPVTSTIRTVMGIRGEPSTPDDPAYGLVWTAIVGQIDRPGSQSDFVSVNDSPREMFYKHPWSIGGGGAAELKEQIEEQANSALGSVVDSIGRTASTQGDDIFINPLRVLQRFNVEPDYRRRFVSGDEVRDWSIALGDYLVFPYDDRGCPVKDSLLNNGLRFLWASRTVLANTLMFGGKTKVQIGMKWFEYGQWLPHRVRTPLSIVYGEVATHNHFVLDRGSKVFNRTAPIIKLPADASEDDHLALLGLLNSSTACFWMKQVAHQKQMMGGDGVRIESKSKVPYAFSGTQLGKMPIPEAWTAGPLRERLLDLTRRIDRLASRLSELTPQRAITASVGSVAAMREIWQKVQQEQRRARSQMVLLQEEIDFTIYVMCGFAEISLLSDKFDWPEVTVGTGERPFDILRDRNEEGFPVPTGIPALWPADLRDVWQRRMHAISQSSELRLIEDPHYKRRWIGRQGLFNHTRNKDELDTACTAWLLDRLEGYFDFDGRMNDAGQPTAQLDIALVSVAKLADLARQDAEFQQVGELFRDDPAFDVQSLVTELVAAECVPLLPVLRYKPSGLIKRGVWERTWDLQRQEDAIDARTKLPSTDPQHLSEDAARDLKQKQVGDIPVPTKYDSKDFLDSNLWSLRGKLDVPKERWVSFPYCEGADGTLMIAWAGYDHLQLARAISAHYVDVQERLGGRDDPRLVPLLGCLIELLPWIKQWHNEPDAAFDGMQMGDYFEGFINEESRQLGKTIDEIKAWTPPQRAATRGRRKAGT